MNFRILLVISCILLSSLGATSQEVNSFYADTTGKLFVRPGTPVFLHIGTKPDGTDAVRLKCIDNLNTSISWSGHGPQQLTHLDLYLGRNIRFSLFVDGKPPKTSTKFNAQKGFQIDNTIYISGSAILELEGYDPSSGVSGVFYSVNNSEFLSYSKPIIFEKEGEWHLKFYAIDNVGNKEDEGERVIIVDTTPPNTTLGIEGPNHNDVVASKTKFILSAKDSTGVGETYYSINNNEFAPFAKQINISNLSEGDHTLKWYSVDLVGNIEPEKSFNFFVDLTPPMVFEEIMGNTYMVAGKEFSSGRSQLRIVAVDNKAGIQEIQYSINKDPFKLYEKPIFLSDITGAVAVRSYAIDNVGNKGTSDAEGVQFSMPEVDITGPDIKHSFTGPKLALRDTLWISPKTKVSISANDRGSGLHRIEYRINDASPITYEDPFTIAEPNEYKVVCTAWDNVENLNISSFEFGVDAKAPEISYHFSVKPHKYYSEEAETIPVFSQGTILYVAATDDIVGTEKISIIVNDDKERLYSQPLSGFKSNQTHKVLISSTDKLGNTEQKEIKFRIE